MKIAVAGYGLEGEANYRYFVSRGHDVTIVDESKTPSRAIPTGAHTVLGKGSFERLDGYDIVARTAGLNPRKIKTDGKIWSATNEFFDQCPAPIIGVTGTKGKGTSASMIASILKCAGQRVHLVGNIGTPALDVLSRIEPEDIVVYELSSFQLWDLHKSPETAVVLMIEPDHLDVHADFEEYVEAKSRIAQAAKIIFYHPTNMYAKRIAESGNNAAKMRYAVRDDGAAYVEGDVFKIVETVICPLSSLKIPGTYNRDNACAAISAALQYTDDIGAVRRGLESFNGLPHRLQYVRTVDDVAYYDDSIATTPGAAIAVLGSFDGSKIIILGGSDKGADYQSIIDECKRTNTRVVAIGQTGHRIKELCERHGVSVLYVSGIMREVVPTIHGIARPGDTVILCPASASFDQYNDYKDRGEQFSAAVERL